MNEHFAGRWRTSTYSGTRTVCVEVAVTPTVVGVRDSKDRDAGTLVINRESWTKFIASLRR